MEHHEFPTVVRFRNSLACVPCRSRHVKCDARKPSCARCSMDGKTCQYMKSRRGLRNKSISLDDHTPLITESRPTASSILQSVSSQLTTPKSGSGTMTTSIQPLTPLSETIAPSHRSFTNTASISDSSQMPTGIQCTSNKQTEFDINIGHYYAFFHAAHPWVLPRGRLNRLMVSHKDQIQELLAVMEFVGSTYAPEGQSQYLRQRAIGIIYRPDLRKDAFTVQALLLLAVGVHCCSNFQQARAILDRAISIALEIGMELRTFCSANGNGDAVLEESWRRTWWGLFTVDGSFEAIHRSHTFRTWHVQTDVDLPCEEYDYASENVPTPHTLAEYNERDFAENEVTFSSFAYLIDIHRIMGSVMAASASVIGEFPDSILDDADGNLMNWMLHLPDEKKDVLRSNGEIDEPLFQAHMCFNVIQVFLHRPRSRLLHSPVETLAKCAPPSPPEVIPPAKQHIYWLSTRKTLSAAEGALRIFTLPTPLVNHTPLVICGVALSILAQLSACSYVLHGAEYEAARSRIRLGIGTLREYGRTWPVGSQTLAEIKMIARDVFAQAEERKKAEEQVLDDSQLTIWEGLQEDQFGDCLGDMETFDYLEMLVLENGVA